MELDRNPFEFLVIGEISRFDFAGITDQSSRFQFDLFRVEDYLGDCSRLITNEISTFPVNDSDSRSGLR